MVESGEVDFSRALTYPFACSKNTWLMGGESSCLHKMSTAHCAAERISNNNQRFVHRPAEGQPASLIVIRFIVPDVRIEQEELVRQGE